MSACPPVPSPLTDRLIVIVGVNRSGTTWIQQLLLAHPRVAGVEETETWLFAALARLWDNVSRPVEPAQAGLAGYVGRAQGTAALRTFCDRLLRGPLSSKPGADHVVERTPAHAWHLEQVAALYPDAWLVHVLRDGRDVAQSLAEVSFGASSVGEAARMWRNGVERVRRDQAHFARFREVRYERVLDDPVGEVAAIMDWVGLPVDDGVRAELAARAGRRVSQWNTTGPVGSGKWQKLSSADRAAIRREAGDLLDALGYP